MGILPAHSSRLGDTSVLSRDLRGPNRRGDVTGLRLFRGEWGVSTSQREETTDNRGGNINELGSKKSLS